MGQPVQPTAERGGGDRCSGAAGYAGAQPEPGPQGERDRGGVDAVGEGPVYGFVRCSALLCRADGAADVVGAGLIVGTIGFTTPSSGPVARR